MTDRRVLIVDDEENVLELLRKILKREGYLCSTATSAEEALRFMETDPPPVVLADVVLPGMNGLEMLARIKERYDSDVIVITGQVQNHTYSEAISRGATDFVVKPVRSDELILRLKRVFMERDLRQTQVRIMRELENLVITDSLTGLYNSRHFHTQIEVEMGRAKRYSHPLALLILDVDRFKSVNDKYGHLEGDRVLSAIANIIQASIRRTDSAYRYGGEEFAVILPETPAEEAGIVAERIRATTGSATFFKDAVDTMPVTVSIGVAPFRIDQTPSAFIKTADEALYHSKQKGRNTVSIHTPPVPPS